MNAFCGDHVRLSVHPSATKVVVQLLSNSIHELFKNLYQACTSFRENHLSDSLLYSGRICPRNIRIYLLVQLKFDIQGYS